MASLSKFLTFTVQNYEKLSYFKKKKNIILQFKFKDLFLTKCSVEGGWIMNWGFSKLIFGIR